MWYTFRKTEPYKLKYRILGRLTFYETALLDDYDFCHAPYLETESDFQVWEMVHVC